ncbi:MAG: MFS transporter [Raoultibacter sp.]
MMNILKGEKKVSDLGKLHRIFILILVSVGSSTIYAPAYLKGVFYDPLMQALGCTNMELGALLSAYAVTAMICYVPAGILADKIRCRTLSWVGFVGTALLTFVYAALPSYEILLGVFVGMGITSILIWWGVRFKLVRLISTEEEYPKNIGMSYGIYGAGGLVVGFINLAIVSALAENMGSAVTVLLVFLGSLILLLGILSFFFIPKFEGEIKNDGSSFNLNEFVTSLKTPVVWMAAASMFFVYFFYTGVTYTTPYLTEVFAAPLVIVSAVSVIRTYGITLISGPIFGAIAGKVKSPAITIAVGSLICAAGLVAFGILPTEAGMVVVAAAIIVLLGFVANGVFGIVSSQLTEGKVPLTIFGAATGLVSVIGFMPDTFSSAWFGAIIDEKGAAAYPEIFAIMAGSAVIAALISVALKFYVRKNNAKLEAIAAAEAAAVRGSAAADLEEAQKLA